MTFLRNLKLWLSPLRLIDPDFGNLTFVPIKKHPEHSYWECEWMFPATRTIVEIALPGAENGPDPSSRRFYLELPSRFDLILKACRPQLETVFHEWRNQPLPEDVFTVLTLTGFTVENPNQEPVHWDVGFETVDDDWLAITIPFVGDSAQDAVVDT